MAFMYRIAFIAFVLASVLYNCDANSGTATSYTWDVPGSYSYVVPANTIRIGISAVGAAGGDNYFAKLAGGAAGRGAAAYAEFAVTPGQTLNIVVGGKGGDCTYPQSSTAGAGGGGGGSFVWYYSGYTSSITYPWIAAGGGGGSSALNLGGTNYYGQNGNINKTGTASGSGYDLGAIEGISGTGAGGKGWIEIRYNPVGVSPSTYSGGNGGYGGGGANLGNAAGGGGGYSGGGAGAYSSDYSSTNNGKVGGGGGGSYIHTNGYRGIIQSQNGYGNGVVTISTSLACQNGGTYNLGGSGCICLSGYKGISCELAPACQAIVNDDNTTAPYPILSNDLTLSKFENDALKLTLIGRYTATRKYTQLNFQGASMESCNFLGSNSFWSQTFMDDFICSDYLQLSLPWTNHTACGFTPLTGSDTTVAFGGKLLLTYLENLGDHFGTVVTRTTVHGYSVVLTFPKKVEASISDIDVLSVVLFSISLSKESYDYNTNEMTLEFTAVSPWSSMLSRAVSVEIPDTMHLNNVPMIDADTITQTCRNDPGTQCVQKLSLKLALNNATLCTFDGRFKVNGTIYACRDSSACSTAPVAVTFGLSSGSICGAVSVVPTISGTLQVSHSLDFSDPTNTDNFQFKLGQKAFFYLNLAAGTGNNVAITYSEISYTDDNATHLLFGNGQVLPLGGQASLFPMPSAKYFTMFFSGAVFRMPFGTTQNFTINVKCVVTYAGNKKREIMSSFNAMGTDVDTAAHIRLSAPDRKSVDAVDLSFDDKAAPATGVSLSSAIGIAAAGVVGGICVVLVVVVAVYKKLSARLLVQGEQKVTAPLLSL